jgi:hypothetical protein
MNKLKDIDYSYFCFLQEALINLEAAEILNIKELYSKSILLYSQSVELSCKYLGLLWKIIPPSDGKMKVGYIPNKIFKNFFSTDVLKQVKGNFLFNQFENELNSYASIEGKINYLINELTTTLKFEVIKRKENQTAIDAMTTFYKAMGYKGMSSFEFIEKNKNSQEFEDELEMHRKTVNNIGTCVLCQMFMSFFVWGNIDDTRYPDIANSKTSMDNYSKSSVITKNLNWFFEIQRNCLNMMIDLHQRQAWLKSV